MSMLLLRDNYPRGVFRFRDLMPLMFLGLLGNEKFFWLWHPGRKLISFSHSFLTNFSSMLSRGKPFSVRMDNFSCRSHVYSSWLKSCLYMCSASAVSWHVKWLSSCTVYANLSGKDLLGAGGGWGHTISCLRSSLNYESSLSFIVLCVVVCLS